jgi:VCBS repeat-containing protein
VNDGTFDSNIATVTITVNGVDDAPVLVTIPNKIVDEAVLLSFTVTAIDSDIPNTLIYTFDGAFPDGASITAGGLLTWTPTEAQGPGFYNITVRVTDNAGLFDNQTFMVKVNEVNVAPVAADDAATVNEDSGPNAIPVLANDMDGDGDTLTVTAVTQGTHGTVAIAGGTVEYTPAADYFGTDSFTYTVSDGNGGTDSAIVTITVVGVNDPPTAADDSLTMLEDGGTQTILVLSNDGIAPDAGETLTVTAVTQGAHGTVAITSGGTRLTYGPAANWHGIDTFTYTVSDGSLTATATVTVTVTSVNDEPVITTVDVKTAISGEDYSVDYSATDADLDTLTWSLTTTADWLAIDPATGVLSGTAELGRFNVQITVSDGNGGTAGRTFVLAVTQLDTDSDGVPDINDAFPTNANETLDTDGDGTGNNADTDDDGDGVPDNQDAFPLNSAETTDTDRDGTGDNADTDDDGDGVPDADDPEPLNAAVTGNEYEPGWPYWYVLIVLGIVALIGLLGLAFVWYIMKKA